VAKKQLAPPFGENLKKETGIPPNAKALGFLPED
jgi:hypothetical protein